MWEWIVANQQWVIIGVLVVYGILPETSPIKQFLKKILGGIVGPQPQPPAPGPTPGPGPLPTDITALIQQVLANLLLKSKASGDPVLEDATTKVMVAIKDEQLKAAASPLAMRQ